jgi:hypothetical protein
MGGRCVFEPDGMPPRIGPDIEFGRWEFGFPDGRIDRITDIGRGRPSRVQFDQFRPDRLAGHP